MTTYLSNDRNFLISVQNQMVISLLTAGPRGIAAPNGLAPPRNGVARPDDTAAFAPPADWMPTPSSA
jgi:hypothetical protein